MPIGSFKFTRFRTIAASGYHPYTQSWIDKVTLAGGTISTSRKTVADTLINGLITDGLIDGTTISNSLIQYFILFATDGFAGCNVPLIDSMSVGNATLNNFVSADYGSAGLAGNGSTKSLNTLFNPSLSPLTSDSGCVGIYTPSNTTATATFIHGCQSATNARLNLYGNIYFYGGQMYDESNHVYVNGAYLAGFRLLNRNGNTLRLLVNNVVQGTGGNMLSAPPNANFFLFANNNNGTTNSYSADILRLGFIGRGLTTTQETNLNSRIQTLLSSI